MKAPHGSRSVVWIALVVSAAVVQSGCSTTTHQISRAELGRLAASPPETRGQAVAVRQEPPWADPPPPAQRVDSNTTLVILGPQIEIGGGGRGGGSRPPPAGGGKGLPQPGKGADAKEAAVAIVVVAVTAVVLLAVIEGARFSGRVQLHPMHPVHLFLRDGNYAVVPLAHIDPQLAAYTERAVVRETEGPWLTLDRDPLDRRGLSYSVLLGAGSSVSADDRLGVGFTSHIQLGYFPSQQLGVLADLVFGFRQNRVNATLFDTRSALELQFWPVAMGPIHGGVFGNAGFAQRIEDGLPGGNHLGAALSGGAQLQLDLTTFLGLTARFGITSAHGDLTREVLFGLSVY
jgi:hypothetical protein